MGITDDEWTVFLDDLRLTLEKFQVPAAMQKAIIGIVHTKLDIVLVGSDVESPAQERDSRIGTSSQVAVSRIAE